MPAASIPVSGNSSTAATDADAELMELVELRSAAWNLRRELDDDEVDATYDETERLDALIAATPAGSFAGIFAKAKLYRMFAGNDAQAAQPLLRSMMRDLFCAPLDDETGLRAVFATLAAPLSADLLKHAAILLKPAWSRLSDAQWFAALDRFVDALRSLDTCKDVDRLAHQVLEPLREMLGETDFATAAARLANEISEKKLQQGGRVP